MISIEKAINDHQVGMVQVEVWAWRCGRCEHVWLPRTREHTPKVCPECKSPYWNRPRRFPKPVRT